MPRSYRYDDLSAAGSMNAAKERGQVRLEGKEYVGARRRCYAFPFQRLAELEAAAVFPNASFRGCWLPEEGPGKARVLLLCKDGRLRGDDDACLLRF